MITDENFNAFLTNTQYSCCCTNGKEGVLPWQQRKKGKDTIGYISKSNIPAENRYSKQPNSFLNDESKISTLVQRVNGNVSTGSFDFWFHLSEQSQNKGTTTPGMCRALLPTAVYF